MTYGYGPNAPSITADEYEFHCSVADCTEHAHDAEDFQKCEACGQLLCAEHVHRLNTDLPFCQECLRCSCGREALIACDGCGELACAEHGYIYDGGEERAYLCLSCHPEPQAQFKLSERNVA